MALPESQRARPDWPAAVRRAVLGRLTARGRAGLYPLRARRGRRYPDARYLPRIVGRGGLPVLECQPELVRLLAASFDGIAEVVARREDGTVSAVHDCYLPVMSLPALLIQASKQSPNHPLYLGTHGACGRLGGAACRRRFGRRPGLGGPPQPPQRPAALLSASRFCPAWRRARGALLRAAKRRRRRPGRAAAGQSCDRAARFRARRLRRHRRGGGEPRSRDFGGHCGGSSGGRLGRPVWTLLAQAADWRWMVEREDSPWYPTMRLVRQKNALGWPELMARLAADLAAFDAAW